MPRLFLALVGFAAASSFACGHQYGSFPASRTHESRFLQRTFRLPLEALLEAGTPAQLVRLSTGVLPTFAAAPVVGASTNPFGQQPATTGSVASSGSPARASGAEAAGAGANPFAADEPAEAGFNADPFADSSSASEDPFADGSSGAAASDPFAGPSDSSAGEVDEAGDDPFADF